MEEGRGNAGTRKLALGLALLGVALASGSAGSEESASEKPFAVEYYYKVKWGYFSEFLELYKKNHYPVLEKIQETGEIVEMRAAYPFYHSGEASRWDFRFTIVWKNAETAHADADRSAILKKLYPNQELFEREEQRRFELLLEHMDIPIVEEDLASWSAER